MIILIINFQIYKTHIKPIKPQKPYLIKPVKPAGLGFIIKPGFYANPDALTPNPGYMCGLYRELPALLMADLRVKSMSDLISWLAGSNTLTPNPGFRCSLYRGTAYPIDRRPQSEVHVRPDKLVSGFQHIDT